MEILTQRERNLIDQAVESTLSRMGIKKPEEISQQQAFKKYGRGIVERWVLNGQIKFTRRGTGIKAKKVVPMADIEKVYDSEKQAVVNFKNKK